jgi:hypothetical protein
MAFTVVFNDDGTINQVHKVGITPPPSSPPASHEDPSDMPGTISRHLQGKSVKNITGVTIVQSNPYTCIMQGGRLWCF